jgi:hypothetical protein
MNSMVHKAAAPLLALPAAVSLGMGMAGPAAAQGVISTSQYKAVDLSNYGPGPVSITSGTTILSTGPAAVSGAGALTNAGDVGDSEGIGIELGAGGGVVNQSGGRITGVDAIRLDAGGAAANAASGYIGGTRYGVLVENQAGTVSNAGTIAAGYDGVSLNHGGQVTNSAGGTITGGHIGVYTGYGLGSVANSGLITARTGDAVSLYTGGSLSNSAAGRIIGGYSGVYAGGNGSSIQNAGLISGPSFGVYLTGRSDVTNGGTIAGGADGVIDVGSGGSVENSGLITGTSFGLKLAADAQVVNSGTITGGGTGVKLGAGSTLANEVSGLIEGGSIGLQAGDNAVIGNAGTVRDNNLAGVMLGSGDTLSNTGAISGVTGILVNGGNTGIIETGTVASTMAGGDAIEIEGGADTLTLGTGAVITGGIDGSGTDSEIALTGTGTLGSDITHFGAGSALDVAQGADWTVSGQWDVASVTNAGTLQPGVLSLTGNFTQTSTGTMRVVVAPEGGSQLNVTGAVRLGGTLVYVLAPGSYEPGGEDFLTATGGIIGSFDNVTGSQPQQAPVVALAELGQSGVLRVTQSFTVGPDDDALFADASQAMALQAQQANDVLLGHAAGGGAPPCEAAYVARNDGSTQAGIAGALAGAFCGAGGWVEAAGTDMNEVGGYGAETAGFLAGVDREVNDLGTRLGLAVGYDETWLSDKSGGTENADTMQLGLYGAQPMGRFVLSGDIMGGFVTTNTNRATGAGGAVGRGNGNILSGAVQISRPIMVAGAGLLPSAGLRVASVSISGFDEAAQSAAFALRVGASGGASVQPYLRMAVSRDFVTASQVVITPQAGLGLVYEAGNPGGGVETIAEDGSEFTAGARRLDAAAGQMTAGIAAGRNNWSVFVRYSAEVAGNWASQTVEAALQVRF